MRHRPLLRRLAGTLSAAAMLTAGSIVFASAASADNNCAHADHHSGGAFWDYRGHHTHSNVPPYYGVHHQVYLVNGSPYHAPPTC